MLPFQLTQVPFSSGLNTGEFGRKGKEDVEHCFGICPSSGVMQIMIVEAGDVGAVIFRLRHLTNEQLVPCGYLRGQ